MSSEVDLLLGLEGGRNETKRQVPPEAWQSLAQAEVKASTQREAEVAQSVREAQRRGGGRRVYSKMSANECAHPTLAECMGRSSAALWKGRASLRERAGRERG